MLAIKGMEMPKSCEQCCFNFNGCIVSPKGELINLNQDICLIDRPSDCPLVEVVTCKDCIYCRGDVVEGIEYLWCDKDNYATSESYYCGSGRKE